MENNTSGERIYILRTALGLSQAQLGKRIKVLPQNISAWERNINHPGIKACGKLIAIAKEHNIVIGYDYLRPELL